MTDKKINPADLSLDVLVADALLRITALERVLMNKGLFTKEELTKVTESLVEQVTKVVMDKLNKSDNLNDFIETLSTVKKEMKN